MPNVLGTIVHLNKEITTTPRLIAHVPRGWPICATSVGHDASPSRGGDDFTCLSAYRTVSGSLQAEIRINRDPHTERVEGTQELTPITKEMRHAARLALCELAVGYRALLNLPEPTAPPVFSIDTDSVRADYGNCPSFKLVWSPYP